MKYIVCFFDLVYNWQTLITGFIALLAAYMTIRPIREQINLQKSHFEAERDAKKWAARSRLPDALSEICRYAASVAEALRTPSSNNFSPPVDAIAEIKEIIQYVDPNASKRLFELLTNYQVQVARLRSYFGETGRRRIAGERDDHYYDIVKLRALADSLFDYARNEAADAPDRPISAEEMRSSLRNTVGLSFYGNEEQYQKVIDTIARRHPE